MFRLRIGPPQCRTIKSVHGIQLKHVIELITIGIRAIRFQKRIEVVVNMQLWDPEEDYTRISVVDDTHPILGVELPKVKVPITPGKNITVICELIAMNHILRHYGYDAAEVFSQRLADQIRKNKSEHPNRGLEYLEHDYE